MPLFERTTTLPPRSGSEDWAAYFREYRRKMDIRNGIIAEEEREPEEPPFTVIEVGHLVGLEELPQGARSTVKRAQVKGWTVLIQKSVTEVAEVRFKENSAEGADKPHNKGDIRYAAHTDRHFGIMMALERNGQKIAATHLIYLWRVDGKSARFVGGRSWDAITKEVEWYAKSTDWDDWFSILVPRPEPKRKSVRTETTEVGIWMQK